MLLKQQKRVSELTFLDCVILGTLGENVLVCLLVCVKENFMLSWMCFLLRLLYFSRYTHKHHK